MRIKINEDHDVEHPVASPMGGAVPVTGEGATCLTKHEMEDLGIVRSVWRINRGSVVEMHDPAAQKLLDLNYATLA